MNFFKSVPKDLQVLSLLIILSLFFHFYNFSGRLNFSTDQAKFSLKAMELWENREISLIGPSISLNLDGREIYQGGVVYYFLLIFLLLGNFDPLTSSLLFSVFAVIAATPLYFGLKLLLNKEKAMAGAVVYLLLPIFINYTGFLWNPNFQLALMPFLFLFLGYFKKFKKNVFLLLAGICFGFLIQFHYQLVIGFILLNIWLRLFFKISLFQILVFSAGISIGLLPLIIYEIRNNFYNLSSLIYFLAHLEKFEKGKGFLAHQHYYISLLIITLVCVLSWVKVFSDRSLIALTGFLVVWDLVIFTPEPKQGFGMAKDWKFKDEQKVAQIIKEENLEGYNFTNLEYDSLYYVQRYFNKKAGIEGRMRDYWETDKLFVVIRKDEDIDSDPAYEIQIIKPYNILKEWEINPEYKMLLLKKTRPLQAY